MSETQLIEFYRKCLEMDFATRSGPMVPLYSKVSELASDTYRMLQARVGAERCSAIHVRLCADIGFDLSDY